MRIVSGAQESLPKGVYEELATYRHLVFVELLGWQLDSQHGAEQDQFDRADTIYIVAKNGDGRLAGCARLLPTTAPYLLGEVFPQLLGGQEPPSSPKIWELSRFAAVDLDSQSGPVQRHLSSPIAVRLLQEAIHCAKARGANRLITVSPIGVERLLRRSGFRAKRAGPSMVLRGQSLSSLWIDCQ